LEAFHCGLLVRGAHAAMNERHLVTEHLFELSEPVLGGHDVENLAFLDERTDPIGLSAFIEALPEPRDDAVIFRNRKRRGIDGLSSGGLFAEHRYVHVAEM